MNKTIFTSLAPNTERDDVGLSLKLLFQPWTWLKGDCVARLEGEFRSFLPIENAVAFESGRTALHAILESLNLKSDDQVLVQGFTCVVVVNAIRLAGAEPIFVDCEEGSYSMDAQAAAQLITPRTKAMIVQHTFGVPADMTELMALARQHGIFVIEDCAHAVGSRIGEKKVGTFGDTAIFSFGRDKVVSSVFGGLAVTPHADLADKLKKLQSAYPEASRVWVFRQLLHPVITFVAKSTYNWASLGKFIIFTAKRLGLISKTVETGERRGERASFAGRHMPNALACLALHQMSKLTRHSRHRQQIAQCYRQTLTGSDLGITGQEPSGWDQDVLMRYSIQSNDAPGLREAAKRQNILLGDWYDTPVAPRGTDYQAIGYIPGSCPAAERMAEHVVNLPTDIHIGLQDAKRIADFVLQQSGRLTVVEVESSERWQDFLDQNAPHTFLQSWAWGEFNQKMGDKVFRLGILDQSGLVAICLCILIEAKRGRFLFCPHGPIIRSGVNADQVLASLKDKLVQMAEQNKCSFVRISPLMPDDESTRKLFNDNAFREAPIHMHPELAWLLDIRPDEAKLMSGMRKTTRYSVRKAETEGVEVEMSSNPDDVDRFLEVYQTTVKRQHFTPFSRNYLITEFQCFAATDSARWFFAHYKGKVISAAMIIYSQDAGYYHHGASDQTYSNIPASYLLQWKAIQEAKRRGCRYYNFWGIAPDDQPKHPWHGLSLFKKGFGGSSEAYAHAKDLPLKPTYWLTYMVEWVRKAKRRL
jgi:dTDP-4-amino-4,6-dideoxygalactose transaminase/lipid II:glycine glycyltransferase (peptidoglycan interpeptide bridge formation enzyme)